jgi:Ca-activated chloride channel homolog
MCGMIQTQLRFDRLSLRANGTSSCYVIAEVTAPPVGPIENQALRKPLSLALVIDASGSMHGSPLSAAKDAVMGISRSLREGDRLTIISFDDEVRTFCEGMLVQGGSAENLERQLHALTTGGCTNLEKGWRTAVDILKTVDASGQEYRNQIVLLTDGHANSGVVCPEQLGVMSRKAYQHHVITTSAVGIGAYYCEHQIDAMVRMGGGRLHDAELASEIVPVVMGELEDVSNVVIDNVIVHLHANGPLKIEMLDESGDEHKFGSMSADSKRRVVYRLTSPGEVVGDHIEVTATVKWRDTETGQAHSCATRTKLKFVTDACYDESFIDKSVISQVAKVWQQMVVLRATQLNREGSYSKAQSYAASELQRFKEYVGGQLFANKMVAEIELLMSRMGHHMEERMIKNVRMPMKKMMRGEQEYSNPKEQWTSLMVDRENKRRNR